VATLRVYRGDQFVAPFELGEGRTRIGRGTDNHLVLEDHDKQVSRVHAEIWHERGRYVIADLNSQNGVWIGEKQIKTEEPLPENVWVTIGPYRLMLMPDEKAPYAPEDLDSAEMTREGGAFVEPTQLAEPAATVPPASQRSHAPQAASARSHVAQPGQHPQTVKPAAAATKPRSNTIPILAAVAALLVVGVVGVMMMRKSDPDTVSETAANTTTTPTTTSSIPGAAPPTPEEAFQDHYGKAQAFIQQGNKASAREENTAALAALPDDPRGVAQRTAIDGMPEPGAPTPLPNGTTPAGTGLKPTPSPSLPESLRVSARAGESEKDRATREKAAMKSLEDGRKALSDRLFDTAITALQLALTTGGRNDYGVQPGEANALLQKARNGKAAAEAQLRHANAQRLVDEAKGLAESDVAAALGKLREARNLDSDIEGAAELSNSLADQARAQGENALRSARNLDARSRNDPAIKEYERAVRLLEAVPGGHKDLPAARERLAELKGGK
jgi:tetratricopeptide (TPR) repeat protein